MTPVLRPCKCGSTPETVISNHGRINIFRLECKCGNRGAALFYTKPALEEWARQAAIDGVESRLLLRAAHET